MARLPCRLFRWRKLSILQADWRSRILRSVIGFHRLILLRISTLFRSFLSTCKPGSAAIQFLALPILRAKRWATRRSLGIERFRQSLQIRKHSFACASWKGKRYRMTGRTRTLVTPVWIQPETKMVMRVRISMNSCTARIQMITMMDERRSFRS